MFLSPERFFLQPDIVVSPARSFPGTIHALQDKDIIPLPLEVADDSK